MGPRRSRTKANVAVRPGPGRPTGADDEQGGPGNPGAAGEADAEASAGAAGNPGAAGDAEAARPAEAAASRVGRGFSMADLVERTGIPVATIHHYRHLGLLPPALEVARNRFVYDERHLYVLLVIRRLRERRLSLDAIADVLPDVLDRGRPLHPDQWDDATRELLPPPLDDVATRLLAVATEAFAHRGYDAVSLSDVAAAAGLSKSAVYRHFPSKEELFLAAVSAAVAEVTAAFEERTGCSGRVSPDRAASELGEALEPYVPIFLDLFSGVLFRWPSRREDARQALGSLTVRIGQRVTGRGNDIERGARVIGRVLQRVVSGAFVS